MKRIILFICILVLPGILSAQVGLRRKKSDNTDLNYTSPKEYEIGGITVSGVETLNEDALISLSGLRVGDKIQIPGDAISSAINKLWAQGIIGDAAIYITNIEGDKVYLNIALKERPRLTRFEIQGVTKTQESDIREKINLIKGRVVTDALVKNTELTVERYFIDKGFLNADVKVIPEKDSAITNNVKLRIKVDKNKKVKIDQINFIGNENISDAKLKSRMKGTKEKPRVTLFKDIIARFLNTRPKDVGQFFTNTKDVDGQDIKDYLATHVKPNVFSGSKFTRNTFEEDKKSIIDFYNAKGYRDARIVADSVYPSQKESMINLDLKVEEGRRYYFRNVYWSGNYVHSDSVLSTILDVDKGDVYDLDLINKKLNYNPQGADISSLYMDNGYLFFNVRPVEVAIEGDSIDVEMRIYEGPQATIKRIIVNGNDRTKDHVILREIRTLPGEKFSREKLIRTQREVLALGYFDQEKFGMNPIPNPTDGTVDIEYTVAEKPSDQIELSAGWGGRGAYSAGGFVGTLGLVFNNFSIQNIFRPRTWDPLPVGDGQTLALRVQSSGRQFQTYSFTFSEPWLGGKKPNSFSVNLSHSISRTYDGRGGRFDFTKPIRTFKVSNITVGLGRRVKWPDDYFTISNSISYLLYDSETASDAVNVGSGIINNGRANNITFNTTFARNSVDFPIYPKRGSSLSLAVSLTPPYSVFTDKDYEKLEQEERFKWVEYHKYMFDASFFNQVIGNLVLNTQIHMGFLGSYGSGNPVGPFERFIVGGDGLSGQSGGFMLGYDIIGLRGYENNSLNPVDNEGVNGGIVYNKYQLQLRYPLSLNPAATIFVQGFAEAGNNWNSYKDFNPFKLYRSGGIGARIFMPAFGMIGIDWAYGFDKYDVPGTNRTGIGGSQFHFTIGQQIR